MQTSLEACVHPHGNPALLLLLQPDHSHLGGSQQLRIPHSFRQQLCEAALPWLPRPSHLHRLPAPGDPAGCEGPGPFTRSGDPAREQLLPCPAALAARAQSCTFRPPEAARAELSLPTQRWKFQVELPPARFFNPGGSFHPGSGCRSPEKVLTFQRRASNKASLLWQWQPQTPPLLDLSWDTAKAGKQQPGAGGARDAGWVDGCGMCPAAPALPLHQGRGSCCQTLPVPRTGCGCRHMGRPHPVPFPGQPPPVPSQRPRSGFGSLLHLHSQGAVRRWPPLQSPLAWVRQWHVTRGPHGCSRLPAALGVFALHSAESLHDPGRAAMGRCQTPALEHPLASHQLWLGPGAAAAAAAALPHTQLGMGLQDVEPTSVRWVLLLPVQLCAPMHSAGDPKVPTRAMSVPWLLGPIGREQLLGQAGGDG